MEREERLQQYGRVSGKPVELSQEIFISKTDRNKNLKNLYPTEAISTNFESK